MVIWTDTMKTGWGVSMYVILKVFRETYSAFFLKKIIQMNNASCN